MAKSRCTHYDAAHHMTGISVIRKAGAVARRILTNEYDASGRVIRQTLADGSVYEIKYGPLRRVNMPQASGSRSRQGASCICAC